MTDARDDFDETLRRAAAEYHRPPDIVPREDMWAVIHARRSAPLALVPDDVVPMAPPPGVPVRASGARRGGLPTRAWWGIAAAASVLLGAGIGIGRWTSRGWTSAPASVPATAATHGVPDAGPRPTAVVGPAPVPASVPASVLASAGRESPPPVTRESRVAPRSSASPTTLRPDGPREGAASVTYTIATLRHLTEVEALLVSFRGEAADSAVNARLSTWARDLVSDTRLLLDSPAAADPRRRRLLEDLEMVLVQLVQLDEAVPARPGTVSERELIDRSLGRGQLLTRLRSAIPAGT